MDKATEFKPVPTRAALALQKKNKTGNFKAIIFEEPKSSNTKNPPRPRDNDSVSDNNPKRRRLNSDGTEIGNKVRPDDLDFDIKKARHEVLNFAMANQRVSKNKKKMQIFQAIKLGAKPPKKAYKNYKDLLGERKRLKDIREERKKFHQLGKNQTGAASVKCRSKTKLDKQNKKRAPVTAIDQHYGVAKPKMKRK